MIPGTCRSSSGVVLRWLFALAVTSLFALGPATSRVFAMSGTDGIWENATSGGSWSDADTGNWSSGTVADGANGTANFSTLDINSNNTVHLAAPRTIGSLVFGDTTPSNDWILDNDGSSSNILTLEAVGVPTITVNNRTATISTVVAGTGGLNIRGAGTLVLGGTNTYSGDTNLNDTATLVVAHASALRIRRAGNQRRNQRPVSSRLLCAGVIGRIVDRWGQFPDGHVGHHR